MTEQEQVRQQRIASGLTAERFEAKCRMRLGLANREDTQANWVWAACAVAGREKHPYGPAPCCGLAVKLYCVCEAKYDCQLHGEKCHGSHE